jgi:hypothetical protein
MSYKILTNLLPFPIPDCKTLVQAAIRPKAPIDLKQSPCLYSDKNSRSEGCHSPAPRASRSAKHLHPHFSHWLTAELRVTLPTERNSRMACYRWTAFRQLNSSHVSITWYWKGWISVKDGKYTATDVKVTLAYAESSMDAVVEKNLQVQHQSV